MDGQNQPRKLFKYYLDQQVQKRDTRPLFFRRINRWRVNATEFAYPLTKKGLFRGYYKYGVLAYVSYWYLLKPNEEGHHDDHGHGHGHH